MRCIECGDIRVVKGEFFCESCADSVDNSDYERSEAKYRQDVASAQEDLAYFFPECDDALNCNCAMR